LTFILTRNLFAENINMDPPYLNVEGSLDNVIIDILSCKWSVFGLRLYEKGFLIHLGLLIPSGMVEEFRRQVDQLLESPKISSSLI
jgi:hypothetical protein